jgi:hypothetical protein
MISLWLVLKYTIIKDLYWESSGEWDHYIREYFLDQEFVDQLDMVMNYHGCRRSGVTIIIYKGCPEIYHTVFSSITK